MSAGINIFYIYDPDENSKHPVQKLIETKQSLFGFHLLFRSFSAKLVASIIVIALVIIKLNSFHSLDFSLVLFVLFLQLLESISSC
jgi:hypothetical protein